LPLDILATSQFYLPSTSQTQQIVPHDMMLSDLILQFEPERRFTAQEWRAGRLPMWAPYQYGGVPLVWPKFSPFLLLQCCTLSPLILPWVQLVEAIVAGLGMYLFCRHALSVSFWPATIVAWCYPLTGFFVFWQGFPTCASAYWLGWILLAVDRVIRRPNAKSAAALSIATCLVLISGHVDVAGQVLLASGLYGVWRLIDAGGWRGQATLVLAAGWALGFGLACPHLLPLLDYAQSGARMQRRAKGTEERPPQGLWALPQIVLPDMYGATRAGSVRYVPDNQIESSAAAYSGLFATLLLAPLAFCSRRHLSFNIFAALITILAIGWCINMPGIVWLLRLPGLNMMSHNRLVFVASFLFLAMAAIGLDVLKEGLAQRQFWFWIAAALVAGLGGWCFRVAHFLPEPIATQLATKLAQGLVFGRIGTLAEVHQVQAWYVRSYRMAGALCTVGVVGWLIVWFAQKWQARLVPGLAILMVADLLWFAHDRSAQCDPALYFPRIPVLEAIEKSAPGRIVGYGCLPAALSQTHNLNDIRGYDSIDPARLVQVLASAAHQPSQQNNYATLQWFTPKLELNRPAGVKLSPILDMLGVRYVIVRGSPPPTVVPSFQSGDYYVLENHNALPRVFVPRHVSLVTNDRERVEELASPSFDPRQQAYVESSVDLPAACYGSAKVISETPTRVTVSAEMQTAGLLVLADRWDKGWGAYLNGKALPILPTNHVLRGVVVPADTIKLEFRYEPTSFKVGSWLCGATIVGMSAWLFVSSVTAKHQRSQACA
jgi:hypothetical protein